MICLFLSLDKQNFILKNGEEQTLNVKAKVLTNPFCSANCSLVLEDLAEDKILYSENVYIQLSSPLSKEYSITSSDEKSGQRLYKVTLECTTIKEALCYTNTNTSKLRTRIVSVDYELNDVQKTIKEALKNETESINTEFYRAMNTLNQTDLNFSSLDLSELENESNSLKESSNFLAPNITILNDLYENQEYSKLGIDILNVKEETEEFVNLVNELNSSYFNKVNAYNLLIDNLSSMHEEISFLEEYNFTNSSILIAESFVRDFNSMVSNINKKDTIENKLIIFNQLEAEKINLLSILENESKENISGENVLDILIYPVNIPKISINYENYTSYFTLEEPSPICCFNNDCYKCINDSSLNYPIILVHGHSFNEKLSAELSMEAFSDMARALERDGYLDAGYFYGSKYDEISKGYLSKINDSIVVEATYYIDTLVTGEGSFILSSKADSIDTYASRLNEVISNVKYLTGKDKVIIVAHSMGSLVTRRYIQLYGDDSLDRVILVGGPNHGIDGFVLTYCPVFGADLECSEMNKSSSFIAELNSAPLPKVPIYNIIGIGCPFEGSEGDGIVKSESAYLEGAQNIYVNGTCSGVDFFHVNMIKPSKYPEVYNIIKDLIQKEQN